ncbi:MAG: hypothetical protein KDA41_07035 [Planctomycetales bacterium]|nr:hypothetical protein [Planctomycetales bacterium]
MAMRENQGLQIALILFVMITVVLAVTTYVSFNSASEASKKEDSVRAELGNVQRGLQDKIAEVEQLRSVLGYKLESDGGPKIDEIKARFDSDMAKFDAGYEGPKDYISLPGRLVQRIVELDQQMVDINEDKQVLLAERDKARAQELATTKKYEKESRDAAAALATMTVDFKSRRDQVVSKMDEYQKALDQTSRQVSTIKADKDKEIDALAQRVSKLDSLRKSLSDKVNAVQNKGLETERPDGKITWVSQRGGTVYINLGSDDGLRRSTMFTVYDSNISNLAVAEPKASLEVTTIRGPHLCEARIVADNLSNPILSQDVVFSPVWNPGQKTHFALVGFMDVDNDKHSDRDLIRNLILQNGGLVDAEVLDNGERQGKLTINTRYLVQGDRATDKSSPEALQAYSNMLKESSDLGIEVISMERLLSDMGWRGSERTVSATSGSAGGGFKPTPKEATTKPSNPAFTPRSRPGSAY